jgi:hypothetical protein
MNLETVHHKIGIHIVRSKSVYGRNMPGFLVALGSGIALGLVLAVCFLQWQSEGFAPARTLVTDFSFSNQDAAAGDEPVQPFYPSLPSKDLVRLLANWRPLWPDRATQTDRTHCGIQEDVCRQQQSR